MSNRARILVASLWVLSLIAVARWASAQGDPIIHSEQPPITYSGNDVAVRVYPRFGQDVPVARVLVRVDGKWQEVQIKSDASR